MVHTFSTEQHHLNQVRLHAKLRTRVNLNLYNAVCFSVNQSGPFVTAQVDRVAVSLLMTELDDIMLIRRNRAVFRFSSGITIGA